MFPLKNHWNHVKQYILLQLYQNQKTFRKSFTCCSRILVCFHSIRKSGVQSCGARKERCVSSSLAVCLQLKLETLDNFQDRYDGRRGGSTIPLYLLRLITRLCLLVNNYYCLGTSKYPSHTFGTMLLDYL